MRSRGRVALSIGAVVAGCGAGQIDMAPRCGDGVIDPGEACDDANTRDDDGCSAACEIEEEPDAGFDCVELLEAVDVDAWAVANAEDGSVLVGGRVAASAESESRGFIGSFDAQGNQLWLREYEGATGIRALRASGDGFLALKRASDQAVLRLDAQGNVEAETPIPDRNLLAMVEVDSSLILGGGVYDPVASYNDAWLARLGADGQVETLLTHDHAELKDEFVAVERAGDRVMALARIGRFDHSDGDIVEHPVEGTMLVELDESGQELDRLLLTSDDERRSWVGLDLTVSNDGTWIVVGQQYDPNFFIDPNAWAVGIREGEVAWTQTIDTSPAYEDAAFLAVEATDAATLVGRVVELGADRLIVRLEPGTGEFILEHYEAIGDGFAFTETSSRAGDTATFVGHVDSEDGESVWRCNVRF